MVGRNATDISLQFKHVTAMLSSMWHPVVTFISRDSQYFWFVRKTKPKATLSTFSFFMWPEKSFRNFCDHELPSAILKDLHRCIHPKNDLESFHANCFSLQKILILACKAVLFRKGWSYHKATAWEEYLLLDSVYVSVNLNFILAILRSFILEFADSHLKHKKVQFEHWHSQTIKGAWSTNNAL